MKHLIDCAMKREPCDLVIENVRVFNVFTGELEEGDIAVAEGRIVGIGKGYAAERVYDGGGRIALPGFLDAHIHIESTMLSPEEFLLAASPRGTTGVIADPHEIVNVCGIAGAEYIREAFSRVAHLGVSPLDLYLELPSCVPATPFETSGAKLDGRDTEGEIARELFFGLGEMMDFPAVLRGETDVLSKISAARKKGKIVDGHCPACRGDALNAYLCADVRTDHESLTVEECREKIARGMYIQIRNGSSANNISDAAKAITPYNYRRFVLCSDDKNAHDLFALGHIDHALRRLVEAGVSPAHAIAAATINTAECYRLADTGAIAPRYAADIVLTDDLESFRVRAVFKRGVLVSEEGRPLFGAKERYLPAAVRNTVHTLPVSPDSFRIVSHGGKFRAMQIEPYGLYTSEVFLTLPEGEVNVKGTDLNKLAVVERHKETGNVGLGLVKGFGFHGGALGISVAHDSHNLIILGDDDKAMARTVALLKEAGGGMAIVGEREEVFPLDIAGLMSSAPLSEVVRRTESMRRLAREMGVKDCYEPFMTPAFLSLAVIPKLKLLDTGLFDLEKYSFVPLEEI